jgi:drug/metabolite transporter (DMT)-like permease
VDLEWHGVALSCFAALLYATYILLGTALKESSDPYASSFVIVLVAGVLLQAMALIQGQTWPHSNQGWGALLFLAVAGTALAICSFIVGLKATGPTLAAVLSTLEPIVTVSLGVLFLHETLAPRAWCGGVLVIGAALALAIKKSRQARRAPASTAAVAGLPCLTLE